MRFLHAAGLAVALCISGCHHTDANTPPKPVATSTSVDAQGTATYFSHNIWPAMVAYSTHPGQASSEHAALLKVIDPELSPNARTELHDAVGDDLNIVQVADATHNQIGTENLQLGNARVANETATDASLNVCYTYTALTYGTSSEPTKSPGASEATVQLVNLNNTWYLHSITNDHVVPSCGANRA